MSQFNRWEKWWTERLSNLPKVTGLLSGRAGHRQWGYRIHALTLYTEPPSFESEEKQRKSKVWTSETAKNCKKKKQNKQA